MNTAEGLFPEGLSSKAQMIWSMLDDMAENDPSSYSKFIEKQIKDGKAHFALPEPHLCIEVLLHKKPRRPLFVNFCSWSKVPEPKSNLHPVPVTGTEIMDIEKDSERGFHSVTSVAFNKKVLDELDQADKADRCTLFNLALDFIEHEHKVKVTRKYKILPADSAFKGDLKIIQSSFAKNLRNRQKDYNEKNNKSSKEEDGGGDSDSALDDSLMSRLSNIVAGDDNNSTPSSSNGQQTTPIHFPGLTTQSSSNNGGIGGNSSSSKKGPRLIEEIKDDWSPSSSLSSSSNSNKLTSPKHSLSQCELDSGGSGGHALVLKVDLPGVLSVAECELDISEDDIKLVVPDQYDLHVKLPSCIEEEEASARFSKKTSVLTVTMPVKS